MYNPQKQSYKFSVEGSAPLIEWSITVRLEHFHRLFAEKKHQQHFMEMLNMLNPVDRNV